MIDGRPGRSPEDDDAVSAALRDDAPRSDPEEDAAEEALEWAGEGSDPTLAVGEARVRRAPRVTAGDDVSEDSGSTDEDDSADAASSALLIASGIVAGLYLLYAIAWVITATRQGPTVAGRFESADGLGRGLYSLGLWLAAAAPPVWFAVVLLVSRDSRVRTRVLWLVAGLVLLAPLPFLKGA